MADWCADSGSGVHGPGESKTAGREAWQPCSRGTAGQDTAAGSMAGVDGRPCLGSRGSEADEGVKLEQRSPPGAARYYRRAKAVRVCRSPGLLSMKNEKRG